MSNLSTKGDTEPQKFDGSTAENFNSGENNEPTNSNSENIELQDFSGIEASETTTNLGETPNKDAGNEKVKKAHKQSNGKKFDTKKGSPKKVAKPPRPNLKITVVNQLTKSKVASHRVAKKIVEGSRVKIGGEISDNPFRVISSRKDKIFLDEKLVPSYKRFFYYYYNKPKGVEIKETDTKFAEIFSFVKGWCALFGTLRKNMQGLVLITNDPRFAHSHHLTHPELSFTYTLKTNRLLTEEQITALKNGIEIKEGITFVPQSVEVLTTNKDSNTLEISVVNSHYEHIYKLFRSIGVEIVSFRRSKIGDFSERMVHPGEWCELTEEQVNDYGLANYMKGELPPEPPKPVRAKSKKYASKKTAKGKAQGKHKGGKPQQGKGGKPQQGKGGKPQQGKGGKPQQGKGGKPQQGRDGRPQQGRDGRPQQGRDGRQQQGGKQQQGSKFNRNPNQRRGPISNINSNYNSSSGYNAYDPKARYKTNEGGGRYDNNRRNDNRSSNQRGGSSYGSGGGYNSGYNRNDNRGYGGKNFGNNQNSNSNEKNKYKPQSYSTQYGGVGGYESYGNSNRNKTPIMKHRKKFDNNDEEKNDNFGNV